MPAYDTGFPVTRHIMDKKLLILVDGSYYLFRAYHALPAFTNSKGEPTGAIFGVVNMLRKLIADYKPDYFAVVFDAKGKNFRNDLYPEYKAHRPEMPEDLSVQIEPLHNLIRAMGIPLIVIDQVEADDVIGTLSIRAAEGDINVLISSGDKDLAQLVNDRIRMVNTMQNIIIDRNGVIEKYGVPPERIIDYLTLVGDSVDNVPGVPKVGPKTAAKWLQEYGTLDNIIDHADDIKGKVGEYLRNSLEQIPLTRKLVTLKCDVELGSDPEQLTMVAPDNNALKKQFAHWQFTSLMNELEQSSGESSSDTSPEHDTVYETVLEEHQLQDWIDKLSKSKLFAFDTETTSLNYIEAELVGISIATEPGHAAYVPLAHQYSGSPRQLDRANTMEKLKPLLESNSAFKVGQNLKYDMNVLANYGIELRGCQHDTMLESYVLDSTATRHDMDSLALKYLDKTTIHYEDVAGKGSKQITFDKVELDTATEYAAEDADITLQLHRRLWPELSNLPGPKQIYEEIEMPLVPVLSRMERSGVRIDTELLRTQSRELTENMQVIESKIFEHAGESFNIGSPAQIQKILYEKLGLPILAKTPKGQPSTAESVLQELAADYPLPRLILDHRSLSKLKSTYTDKLPEQVSSKTGRVHTSYHQAVAATGRLSSSDPNLQNIPVRTEEGRRIRSAFIAADGYSLLSADYSQIELRIMAHLSRDKGLVEAFRHGEDIHRITASEVFSTNLENVSIDQRRAAKAINFGLIYGMSAFGLSKQLGIDRGEAKSYVDLYFERYPGVKKYMDDTRELAREQGYVETLFKRRLYLPEINARNAARRQYAERTAINAPMQGTAADIIKKAMIQVDDWLSSAQVQARIIMQVHDELVLEVKTPELSDVKTRVEKIMANAAVLIIPLVVDSGTGLNWNEAH